MSDDSNRSATAERQFHPDFSDPSADIVLVASDGTKFRMHSNVLRTTSEFFKNMLSLPRTAEENGVIPVEEPTSTLEPLLRIICGLGFPGPSSADVLEAVAIAAHKYDMPGPLSYIHALLPLINTMRPLQMYALGSRLGLADICGAALQCTLDVDIHLPEHKEQLVRLDGCSMLKLIEMRRDRRLYMDAFFNAGVRQDLAFTGAAVHLPSCRNCHQRHHFITGELTAWIWWKSLQTRVIDELDRRPSGQFLKDRSFEDWPEMATCPSHFGCKCGFPGTTVDKAAILRAIRAAAMSMPTSV